MDLSHSPPSEPDDGLSSASPGSEHHSSVARSGSRSTWFRHTFGERPYLALEQLVPHRTLLVDRLDNVLAPSVLMRIKHAQTDWDGITVLARFLSAPNPCLQAAMERVIRDLPELQTQLQAASSTRVSGSMPPAALFPEPAICEGRDALVTDVVAIVTGSVEGGQRPGLRSAVLHGIGGIGKSTVALEVLDHLDVISHFRARRFFVGCENLSTLDALVGRLVTQLAIDTKNRDAKTAICEFGMSSPALLVLDNFEDLWNADGPTIEPFLSTIAKENGFNVIVTKRGRSDLRLPRMRSFAVDSLDNEPALHAFIRHADRGGFDEAPDPDLPRLVDRLDGYPLALMLLAHQYDSSAGVTAKQLLVTYERRRSDCLKRGEVDARQTSLRASVDLSLASTAMSTAGAKELCFLLSLLPDGAEDELIDAYLDRTTLRISSAPLDLSTTKLAVVGAGLATTSAQGLLRMLAPLRELFVSFDPSAVDVRADAHLSIHEHTGMLVELSGGVFNQKSAEESVALRRRVTVQLGNLSEAIKSGLASEEPSQLGDAVQTAANLAYFIWLTVPFIPEFLSWAIEKAKSSGLVQGEADCQQALGQILRQIGRLDAARSSLHCAMALYEEIDDQWGQGHTLKELGRLAGQKGDLCEAQTHLGSALAIFEEIGDQLQEANTLECLGSVARGRNDLRTAEAHYESARAIFKDIGDLLGEANTLSFLGELALRREDLPLARIRLEEALRRYEEIGDRLGEAATLRLLGDLARRQGSLTDAQICLDEALALARGINDQLGEAAALKSLGQLALQQGDLSAAHMHLGHALAIFKRTGYRLGEANASVWLGDLALRQNNLSAARTHFEEALALYRRIGDRIWEAETLWRMGDLELRQGNLCSARRRLGEAIALYKEQGDSRGEKTSNRLLADVTSTANTGRRRIERHHVDSAGRSLRSRPSKIPVPRGAARPTPSAHQVRHPAQTAVRRTGAGSSRGRDPTASLQVRRWRW